MSIKQLRERALAAGVSGEAVEGARDADEPKAALISLLVARDAKSWSAADLSAADSDDERPPGSRASDTHSEAEDYADAPETHSAPYGQVL